MTPEERARSVLRVSLKDASCYRGLAERIADAIRAALAERDKEWRKAAAAPLAGCRSPIDCDCAEGAPLRALMQELPKEGT
jgi:hypothetical protein